MIDFDGSAGGNELARVFLSYDRRDLAAAQRVAAALQRFGHDVWWDRHIRGGAEFSEEIDRALEASDKVVVLWSTNSIASPWVRDEAAAGRDSGRLVPALIDQCKPPLGFRQYQTIDLKDSGADGDGPGLEELNQALQASSGAAVQPRSIRASKPSRPPLSRRTMLMGAGTAAALAAVGGTALVLTRGDGNEVPPEVQPLMLQAKQLMNQNTREGQYQAIGLYRRAVEIAPDYADGWGLLAHAYAVVSHYRERQEGLAFRGRAEAAARHALELDPRNALAEMALGVAVPFIGPYAERERRLLRAFELSPDNSVIIEMLAVVLQFVGRSSEAVGLYPKIREKPLTPAAYNNYLRALWSAGRLAELDQATTDAASLYPTQASIWSTRVSVALYGGQPDAVAALVQDSQSRPSRVNDEEAASLMELAQAIRNPVGAKVDQIIAAELEGARVAASLAEEAIRNCSALGRLDDAFAISDAYYFSLGFEVPDYLSKDSGVSTDQRQTRLLFEPVTRPMRADPRFEPLVKKLGLDAYWRQSGKPPDYRRIAGL